ncbi:MAG: lipoate--protein ligase family protein [Nitrospiraceae bacterium]|nr:lipoate--protein ligase family protein [Nitrospiraceae bacterium]
MRLLDVSFKKPLDNLAFDEVLLDEAETKQGGEVLRFWESPVPFVVLGVTQALRREVNEKHCIEDRVPILRRCTAGGCVLQGPGCLNYTLALAHAGRPEIRTIRGSYCYILDRLCEAFRQRGLPVRHKGTSDLALGGKKISGSAQKRRRKFILHHGTLLYSFDPNAMERYLREPEDRPQYRGPRTHRGFVRAVPLTAKELRQTVRDAFGVTGAPQKVRQAELRTVKTLAREKYADPDWIRRR